MADYITSTHRAKWIFIPEKLTEKRKFANQRAKQLLEKNGTSRMEVDSIGCLSYPEPLVNNLNDSGGLDKHSRPKALNVEEEEFMRVYYEYKLREVCSAFYFPHKIQATALIYFKRFYLKWSVMEHDPKHIMLTCIYAACKIEENHVSAEELGKGISQDHQVILNYEMIVLQTLEFDLIVFTPYRCVEGLFNDMMESANGKSEQVKKLTELLDAAIAEVDKIMFTDAPLLFPPGQIALAALRISNTAISALDFDRYLNSILLRRDAGFSILDLCQSLDSIELKAKEYKFPTERDMKHINRKLKSCWGHNSHDESKKREKKSKHKSQQKISNEIQNIPMA